MHKFIIPIIIIAVLIFLYRKYKAKKRPCNCGCKNKKTIAATSTATIPHSPAELSSPEAAETMNVIKTRCQCLSTDPNGTVVKVASVAEYVDATDIRPMELFD